MELLQDTPIADIEAALCCQLARNGVARISADELAEAICARCHEEVRVWMENFARAHDALAEEDPAHTFFVLKAH
ncbi:MAG: hypothetical protein M3Y13_07965 [Armatimonadota bacterium]|nr:hypothetical protein [Armatimonadota bacterium]